MPNPGRPHSSVTEQYFELARLISDGSDRLRRYNVLLFAGVPLAGRSVLDVGGGSGIISFYAASRGARPVFCLEPGGAGSNPRMDAQFRTLADGLGDTVEVNLIRQTFQALDPLDQRFDVVLVHSAINHLDEEACARLPHDVGARDKYRSMFAKLAELSAPGADLVITDAASNNAWGMLGMRSPFAPSIKWAIHAQPEVWAGLAEEAGFSYPVITWRAPNKLGTCGQRLLGNRMGAWLTSSMFRLHMRRS